MKGLGEDEHMNRFDRCRLCQDQWSHTSTVQFYVKQLTTLNLSSHQGRIAAVEDTVVMSVVLWDLGFSNLGLFTMW